jgi:hypothetical protein
MDIRVEPVLILLAGGPPQPREDTKAGVMLVIEDPRRAKATEIPVTEPFQ